MSEEIFYRSFYLWILLYKEKERCSDILVVQVQPPCYLTTNSSARYPDCCAQITCPKRPNNTSFSTGKLRLTQKHELFVIIAKMKLSYGLWYYLVMST
jgi:hypothetical protein